MSNNIAINIGLSDLQPNEKYFFNFQGQGGNWPAVITPVSGFIQPNSETYQLKANVHFCDSLSACSDNIKGYLPYNSGLCDKSSRAYTAIAVDVSSQSTNFVLHDNVLVECDNCIPVITVSAPETVELSKINGARDTIAVDVVGVKANQVYTYSFESLFGNWPMYVSPISGQFIPTSDTYRIVVATHPCYSHTGCDTNNLLSNYVLNKEDLKYASTKLKIVSQGCAEDNSESSVISINCIDCLPDTPSITNEDILLVGNGNNKTTLKTEVTDIDRDTVYTYSVKNIDCNWPVSIYPLSGTISNKELAQLSTHVEFCNSLNSCSNVPGVINPSNNALCVSVTEDKKVTFEIELVDDINNTYSANPVAIECKSCLDRVSITAPEYSQISATNSYTMNSVVSGLVVGDRYSYHMSLDHATWPVIVEKPSGSFIATSSSKILSNKISFCPSTGLCTDAVWSIDNDYSTSSYAELSLTIEALDCEVDSVTSNSLKVECNNCIKRPVVVASQPSSALVNTNRRTLNFTANNLVIGQSYDYLVKATKSNWPILVDNISGTFVATSTSKSLSLSSTFCPTETICDGNIEAIQPTNTAGDDCLVNAFNDNALYANLYLSLVPAYSANETVDSNIIESVCLGCLPKITISAPINSILTTTNKTTLNFLVSGLEQGHEYSYVFSDQESNWPYNLANPSGSFVANGSSAVIPAAIVIAPTIDGTTASNRFNDAYQAVELYQDNPVVKLGLSVDSVDCDYASSESSTATLTCNQCLPKITTQVSNVLLSNHNNSDNIILNINNLIPKHSYSYTVMDVESNWPVTISPMSGTFIATQNSSAISSKISFCPTTSGVCFGSNVANLFGYENGPNKEASLYFKVSSISHDVEPSLSSRASVLCNDCLPEISISSNNPTLTDTDTTEIVSTINGLVPYNTYHYIFTDANSDWPVAISAMSGTFYTTQSTHILNTLVTFCATDNGVCSSGNNVIPFVVSDNCNITDNKRASMRLKVWSDSTDISETISPEILISCNDCISKPIIANINNAVLSSTNVRTIAVTTSSLQPNIEYEYVVESIQNTWPIRHINASGRFIPNSSSYTFSPSFEFCRTVDGPCSIDDRVLSWSNSTVDLCDADTVDVYGKYRVKVQPTNCDLPTVYSNEFSVTCVDCTNTVKVNIPTNITLTEPSDNSYSLNMSVSGLQPRQTYQYVINAKDTNWPVIATPRSGEFVATTNTRNITSDILFCYPSGMCDENSGAFDFTEFTYLDKQTKGSQLQTTLEVSVTPVSCEGSEAHSNEMSLSCDNCLPSFSYASIRFSGSPELTLPDTCCSGIKTLSVNVIGAVPSDPYYYEFTSRNENIVFAPSTGIMYFDISGSGSIMTLMDTNLSLFEHGVIQCNVKHLHTGFEAIDMIAIKCGNDCSAYYEGLVGQP